MRNQKLFLSLLLVLILVCNMISSFTGLVFSANNDIDTSVKSSIEIEYSYGDKELDNVEVKLYKVANLNSKGEFSVLEQFDFINEDYLNDIKTDAEFRELAENIENFVHVNHDDCECDDCVETNSKGIAEFDNLKCGLYYVEMEDVTISKNTYSAKPMVVSLPEYDEINKKWNYDVEFEPKIELITTTSKHDVKVIKTWKNDSGYNRPNEIVIDLYCNGKVYDTVKLNSSNSWSYQWKDLNVNCVWGVVERDVPKGYTVSYLNNSYSFEVVNTYVKDPPSKTDPPNKTTPPRKTSPPRTPNIPFTPYTPYRPTPTPTPTVTETPKPSITPTPSQTPTPSEPSVPSEPPTPSEPNVPSEPPTPSEPNVPSEPPTPSEPNVPDIPQTGTLMRLITPLCSLGILLIVAGIIVGRKKTL